MRLRKRIAFASSLAAAGMAATLMLSMGTAGVASAGVTIPAWPTNSFGTYPHFYTGSVANVDHSEGSDTTLFMMQTISNLYGGAGILPFSCQLASTLQYCNTPASYTIDTTGATAGTFSISIQGFTTDSGIAFNATAATIQATLSDGTHGPTGTTVTGGPAFVVTPPATNFTPAVQANFSGLTGGTDTDTPSSNPNVSQTNVSDNFSGTEELQGTWNVGSGAGQKALCGTINVPLNTTVDYSRSSKPAGGSGTCATEQEVGYAKDAAVGVDFQNIDPEQYGTASGYIGTSFPSFNAAGTLVNTPFPSGGIGPVAAGWLPGDPFNCVPAGSATGTPCSGTPFTDVDNTGGLTSVAYRLWCQHGAVTTGTDESQITDWGQLTNLSAAANGGTAQTVGNGAPIGVPIRILGVNPNSGTMFSWMQFSLSGNTNVNCSTTGDYDANAASGPNPQTGQGQAGNLELALENDANQIGDFANADWGLTDAADQAVDIATSLYFMSFGVYNTNANATEASIQVNSGVIPSGDPSTFAESVLTSNNIAASTANDRSDHFPGARTLFNIFRTDSVKASVGGFVNWICDGGSVSGAVGGTGPMNPKGPDHFDGLNYDTDLTNIIQGQYGFSRLTDTTAELPGPNQVTASALTQPNATCAANLPTQATTGMAAGSTTITLASPVPASVQPGWTVMVPNGYTVALPTAGTASGTGNGYAGDTLDTVSSVSGNTITLTTAAVAGTGTIPNIPPAIYFPGHPPVLQVTNLSQ